MVMGINAMWTIAGKLTGMTASGTRPDHPGGYRSVPSAIDLNGGAKRL
jgi:hypothetical protein